MTSDQQNPSLRPTPLEYARRSSGRASIFHIVAVAALVMLTASGAIWCVMHTIQAMRILSAGPYIDFPPDIGMRTERSIPLGILAAGVALVGFIHLVRISNRGRKVDGIDD